MSGRLRGVARRVGESVRSEPAIFGAVAVVVYAVGIGWGLPHATSAARMFPWGPDELAPLRGLGELHRLFVAGPPYNSQYPLLQYAVQAVFALPYVLLLAATGGIEGMSGGFPFGLVDPVRSLAVFTVLARIPTVLMAAGTVVAAWWTGRRVWGETEARLCAVATLLAYPMFFYGRTSNVDVPALFWLACGTAVFVAAFEDGLTTRRGILIGLFAGLSVGTKDAGYAYFGGMAAVLIGMQVAVWRATRTGPAGLLRPLLAGAGTAAVVYAVASGLVFSLDRFAAHVEFIVQGTPLPEGVEHPYYYSGEASLAGYVALAGRTARHVVDALGLPLALAALAGLGLTARAAPRRLWLLLPALGVFLAVIVPVRFVLIRFVLPIEYVVGLFAAPALARLLAIRGTVRGVGVAAATLAFGWAGLRAADLTAQMLGDARYAIGDWLEDRLEPGAEVGYYGSSVKLPHLPADVDIGYMPGQVLHPEGEQRRAEDPDVILIIPQQDNEPVHEWTLTEADYEALVTGRTGYRRVWQPGGDGWFGRSEIPFVNPPIQVFVRDDRVEGLPPP